jgi:UPF0716 protein FxsA
VGAVKSTFRARDIICRFLPMPLILAFLVLPIIEIALFILVGGWIGLWATLALVILAAVAGTALMRGAGADATNRIRASMAQDADPSGELVRMAMRFVAGMLLVVPGFLTDAVALVLLVPQVQRAAFSALRRRAQMSGAVMGVTIDGTATRPRAPADRVIDGEFHELPPRSGPPQSGPSRWSED